VAAKLRSASKLDTPTCFSMEPFAELEAVVVKLG
jgi:hypothetical protein